MSRVQVDEGAAPKKISGMWASEFDGDMSSSDSSDDDSSDSET